jgi:hypothetical protein
VRRATNQTYDTYLPSFRSFTTHDRTTADQTADWTRSGLRGGLFRHATAARAVGEAELSNERVSSGWLGNLPGGQCAARESCAKVRSKLEDLRLLVAELGEQPAQLALLALLRQIACHRLDHARRPAHKHLAEHAE